MTSSAQAADTTYQSLVLIQHLERVARRRFEIAIEPTGLRPRHVQALTILRDHGAISQGALGDALRLDPANIVGLLNELEQRALLARRRDPTDRRRHIVELSPAGRTALTSAESALASVQNDVLSGLDNDERCTLHRLLLRAAASQIANDTCTDAANELGPCIQAADEPDSC
ncbi:MAG: MarR family winged helix-turn-helix transcriptional regulator [Solirubrobacteraceae bacterium]